MGRKLQRTYLRSFVCARRRGFTTIHAKSWVHSCRNAQAELRSSSLCGAASSDVSAGIFPAGKKQAKVQVPALHVCVSTDEALALDVVANVDAYIRSGATSLVVRDASSGGADLFKAAAQLKDVVRGRVPILLVDRTDIVSATQVDGVVLTERGVPIAVARQILSDPSYLIGVCVSSLEAAAAATADGASFLVVTPSASDASSLSHSTFSDIAASSRSGLQIPLIVCAAAISSADLKQWQSSGLDGLHGTSAMLLTLHPSSMDSLPDAIASLSTLLSTPSETPDAIAATVSPSSHSGLLSGLLGNATPIDDVITREKAALAEALEFLNDAVPEMSESRLLKDAILGLDEPFLLVVVGEFNSGKSTVINALLGAKFLEDGILPTTNEISVLKHSERAEEAEQTEDGLFMRALPSELLRKLNIVDTPGTNVIVDRQQRLTEEFVPRSDLVLFIMSADRPFTESEVTFLRYIRQWGKKVVFVLNKVDIFERPEDVAQVTAFVEDNARDLLGVDAATVLPVSARQALDAKLDAGAGEHGGVLQSVDVEATLAPDERWQASRFLDLEQYMLKFLTGSDQRMSQGATGVAEGAQSAGESTRLKLQTPLFVAEALMQAAEQQLELECTACTQEVAAVNAVERQLSKFEKEMENDGVAQRTRIRTLLAAEQQRAEAAISASLQLSNFSSLTPYIFGGDRVTPKDLPVATALTPQFHSSDLLSQLDDRVREHAAWIESNGTAQLRAYTTFVAAREDPGAPASAATEAAPEATPSGGAATADAAAAVVSLNGARAEGACVEADVHLDAFGGNMPQSVVVLADLDTQAIAEDLESRVRDVVVESTNTAGGAFVLGLLITVVLPTTLEDLLALTLSGFFAYVSFLNWPIRRGEIKAAVGERFGGIADALDSELQGELAQAVGKVRSQVTAMVAPLQERAEEDLKVVEGRRTRLKEVQELLDSLRTEINQV